MIQRLHEAVAAVCPIDGVSRSQGSVRVDYRPDATQQQRDAAQLVVDTFDWSNDAQVAWEADQHPERKDLRAAAAGAISDNDAFLAIASPSNAQVLAQVKRLTQQNTRIIRRLSQID